MKFERLTKENAVALTRPLIGNKVSVLVNTDGMGKIFTVFEGRFWLRGDKGLPIDKLEMDDIWFIMTSPKSEIITLEEMLSQSEILIYPLLKSEYYHWVHQAVLAKIKEDEDEQR